MRLSLNCSIDQNAYKKQSTLHNAMTLCMALKAPTDRQKCPPNVCVSLKEYELGDGWGESWVGSGFGDT